MTSTSEQLNQSSKANKGQQRSVSEGRGAGSGIEEAPGEELGSSHNNVAAFEHLTLPGSILLKSTIKYPMLS